MATGSTGSTFPKWQLAILIGAPVAFGLGYIYWSSRSKKLRDDDEDVMKKKLLKDKTISIDADEKSRREDDLPLKPALTPLQIAQEFKNQGNTVFKKAKYDEAIEFYDKAIEACPKTSISDLATFYQNRAAAYEQLKKYNSVIDDCTNAIELNPKYVKALHRRARAYETIKEYAKCLEDTTATCIFEGFQNRSTLILADRVLKELGRIHAKEAMCDRKPVKPSKYFVKNYFSSFSQDPVMKIIGTTAENPVGFLKAKLLLDQEEYDEVIVACTEEIESSEAEAEYKMEATLLRATMYLLTGRFGEASIDLDAVINNNDASPSIRVNALIKRASLNMQTEKPEECFDDLNQAEKLDSTNGDIFHHRGQVFILLEQLEHALNDFTKACKLCPLSGVAWAHKRYAEYRIAFQSQNHAQILEVMADFMRTIEQFPKCVECYSLCAQALTDQQQFNEADNHFEKAIKVEPNNAQIQVHRALLALQWKGDVNSAVSMIEKAIEADDKCEFAYETLGTIEVQRGNLEKAVSLFDDAINFAKSEMELIHLYSLRDAAIAQINVTKKMGIDVHNLATLAAGMNM